MKYLYLVKYHIPPHITEEMTEYDMDLMNFIERIVEDDRERKRKESELRKPQGVR